MEKTMVIYDTVKQYSQTFNNSALHPLISLVDLGKSNPLPRSKFKMGIYAIIIKESKCGDLRYGNTYYDYDEGTIVFLLLSKSFQLSQKEKCISPLALHWFFIQT
jgi:hypothetical protein